MEPQGEQAKFELRGRWDIFDDADYDGPIGDGPQGPMIRGSLYADGIPEEYEVLRAHIRADVQAVEAMLGELPVKGIRYANVKLPPGVLATREAAARFAAVGMDLSKMGRKMPNLQDWAELKRRERARMISNIDDEIRMLTRRLAELQELKEKRLPLEVLTTLKDGAVVYFEIEFKGSPGTYYQYSAIRGGDLWHTTGRNNAQPLGDYEFIEFLDRAAVIVLLQPFSRTLRDDRPKPAIEGETTVDEKAE